jgi:hypothetical protein
MPLKGSLKSCHGDLGGPRVFIGLSPRDRFNRHARALGEVSLRQTKERPSGAQLSGCDRTLVHQDRTSAALKTVTLQ